MLTRLSNALTHCSEAELVVLAMLTTERTAMLCNANLRHAASVFDELAHLVEREQGSRRRHDEATQRLRDE
jgi:hypothetical protein